MKKFLAVLLTVVFLLSALPAMADSALPYQGDPIVYKGFSADMGFVEDYDTPVLQAYLADLGNVTIDWTIVPSSDLATKVNVFFNSGDIPDITWSGSPRDRIRDYGNMGYFLNLNDYADYMPNLQGYKENYKFLQALETEDGALYCIVDIEPYDYLDEVWFYNKTALDELGLDVPNTWDEMYAAMLAYKEANPDGLPLQTYAWGYSQSEYMLSQIGGWQYDEWFFDDNAGKWVNNVIDTNDKKAITEMLAQLYKDELIHPEFSTTTADILNQYILSGNWLFGYWYKNAIERERFKGTPMPFELDSMLTPALTADAPRYGNITVRYDSFPGWAYFASADVDHPEVMASILDYFISPRASELFNWGVEGLTFEYDESGERHYLDDFATNTTHRTEVGINTIQGIRCIMLKDRYSEYYAACRSGQLALDKLSHAFTDGSLVANVTSRGKPAFTDEENETISYSTTPMSTYLDEQLILFVDGTRPLSEWEDFVEEYKGMGDYEGVLNIYENAKQVEFSTERRFPLYNAPDAD